ncbi:MAG: YqgE/AlgH family protein [Kiloniellales bacterium]
MTDENNRYLSGKLLIAMPGMMDLFARTVVCLCAHNADGAMGLVVNRLIGAITFPDVLAQLGIDSPGVGRESQVHFGGPVESGRGFVLHSSDYQQDGTLKVSDLMSLTATIDILRDMAGGGGPRLSMLALGYAGWGPGQLDTEIQANGWLHVEADEKLVFDDDLDGKWERAISKLGFDASMLSGDVGHA